MHIPDGYLSPQTCASVRRGDGSRLVHGRPPGEEGGQEPLRAAARDRRRVLLPRHDVQRADPRRHDRARGRRGAGRGAARTVGGGDRGEHRAADPGAVLRRRRRARLRRELLQHGVRHADGRLRRVPAARPATSSLDLAPPRARRRHRRVRRAERRRAVRGDRVRRAARPVPRRARHPAVRAVPPRADRSRRCCSPTSRSPASSSSR